MEASLVYTLRVWQECHECHIDVPKTISIYVMREIRYGRLEREGEKS